jgi:hypothetical protein
MNLANVLLCSSNIDLCPAEAARPFVWALSVVPRGRRRSAVLQLTSPQRQYCRRDRYAILAVDGVDAVFMGFAFTQRGLPARKSSLSDADPESEAVVTANLERIASGRTMIIVSHRLSSLVDCD